MLIKQPTGYLLMTLFAVLLAMPLHAQESPGAAEPPASDEAGQPASEETAGEAADTAAGAGDEETADETEEIDDSDLDEQVYEKDDDDFIPSEEIPADEAIPFPTNI